MTALMEELMCLSEEDLDTLEKALDIELAAYECEKIYNIGTWYHDDQHPGELQKNYNIGKPGEERPAMIRTPDHVVIDSLEGNTLMQPRHTPVIEVDKECTRCRILATGFGYEALAKYREEPMAIYSVGIVPGVFMLQDNEWRQVSGGWTRVVKADMTKSWIYDMQHTNCRPPLSPEEDASFLGKYAYKKDRARKPFPAPPEKDTFEKFPEINDEGWKYKYAPEEINNKPTRTL